MSSFSSIPELVTSDQNVVRVKKDLGMSSSHTAQQLLHTSLPAVLCGLGCGTGDGEGSVPKGSGSEAGE